MQGQKRTVIADININSLLNTVQPQCSLNTPIRLTQLHTAIIQCNEILEN